MNRLQNKVAIVTGANSGIGLRTAQLFAEEGAILVLCARRKEKLDEVAVELRAQGTQVLSIAADVSREEDCGRVGGGAVDPDGAWDSSPGAQATSMEQAARAARMLNTLRFMDSPLFF